MDNEITSLKTLLQLPRGWKSSRQTTGSDGITLHLRATRKTAQCPECLKRCRSVHSCRRRRIQHLPCSGQALWLIFAVRHWYCRNPSCPRKIFAESLAPFAQPPQQSSTMLQNMQHQLGLIAGGDTGCLTRSWRDLCISYSRWSTAGNTGRRSLAPAEEYQ